jgi:hypothetical protein
MSMWNGWRVVMFCIVGIGAAAAGRAQTARSRPTSEALTFNGDGAQRFKDIHWPAGYRPEQADLFAHNEIVRFVFPKRRCLWLAFSLLDHPMV